MQADLELNKKKKKAATFPKVLICFETNLHSCQSTERGKKVTHGKYSKKCACSAVFKEDRAWGLPSTRAVTETFRFLLSATAKSLVRYFSCGVYCTVDTLQFSPSSVSFAFLFIFWSPFPPASLFPIILFLPHKSLPVFQTTLPIWVSFLFITTELSVHCPCPHCHALLSIYTHIFTWSAWHRSPGRSRHLPQGRDDSGGWSADWAWERHRHELTRLEVPASHFHSRPVSPCTGQPPAKLKSASFRVV